MTDNPYQPHLAVLERIDDEGPGIRTFHAAFQEPEIAERFAWEPGQFVEVSVLGVGESPFGIAKGPGRPGPLAFSVAKMGTVTSALHGLSPGDAIGLRGPLGKGFPLREHEGKSIYIIAGGIGMPPLRSVVEYALDNRAKYERVVLVYGARSPDLLCYKDALGEWAESLDLNVHLTVDQADDGWRGHVGVVPTYCEELALDAKDAVAYTVGPPIMIHFAIVSLTRLGFTPEQIFPSLEAKMKCGLGKCGRCNVGPKLVCLHGPVFSYRQLLELRWSVL